MKVCIIGSGSWGTALAIKSVVAGNDTILYCRRPEFRDELIKYRENRVYLAGVILPDELMMSSSGNITPAKYDLFSLYLISSSLNSERLQYKVVSFPATTDLIARAVPQLPDPTMQTFILLSFFNAFYL